MPLTYWNLKLPSFSVLFPISIRGFRELIQAMAGSANLSSHDLCGTRNPWEKPWEKSTGPPHWGGVFPGPSSTFLEVSSFGATQGSYASKFTTSMSLLKKPHWSSHSHHSHPSPIHSPVEQGPQAHAPVVASLGGPASCCLLARKRQEGNPPWLGHEKTQRCHNMGIMIFNGLV